MKKKSNRKLMDPTETLRIRINSYTFFMAARGRLIAGVSPEDSDEIPLHRWIGLQDKPSRRKPFLISISSPSESYEKRRNCQSPLLFFSIYWGLWNRKWRGYRVAPVEARVHAKERTKPVSTRNDDTCSQGRSALGRLEPINRLHF